MKKLAGVVVILVVLLMGGYYGMGILTEHTLKQNIDIANRANGLFIDIVQYNRGWFVSSAQLNVKLTIPERVVKGQNKQMTTVPAEVYSMEVPFDVFHGPIIYTKAQVMFGVGYAQTRLDLPEAFKDQFYKTFASNSTLPVLDLAVFLTYLNSSHLKINLPPFTLFGKTHDGQIEWLGMGAHVNISNDTRHIDGNLTLKGVNIEKNKTKAILGQFNNYFTLYKTDVGLYLGKAGFSLPSLAVFDDGKSIFELNKFSAQSDSEINDGLLHSSFKLSLDKVVAKGQVYGPVKFNMSINNLDAKVLAKINEQANKIQQGSEAERQQAMFAILPELPKLVGQGASFEISTLSVRMPEGELAGNVKIALPKDNSSNPFKLLQKVYGEGRIQMPSVIVKQLVEEALKQKLMQQSALQQAMVSQMQNNSATTASHTQQPAATEQEPASHSDQVAQSAPMTEEAAAKQAKAEVENKLSALLGAKLLVEKGSDYMVEFKFDQGQLTINGQPFNPAMLKL